MEVEPHCKSCNRIPRFISFQKGYKGRFREKFLEKGLKESRPAKSGLHSGVGMLESNISYIYSFLVKYLLIPTIS